MLDWSISILGFVIIAFHTWSLKFHFDMPKAPSGVKLISVLVLGSAGFLTFLVLRNTQPEFPQIIGLVLLIASLLLFWSAIRASASAKLLAAFDEKLPQTLLQTGPYAYVRHPFYSSYLLQWTGWAIASWHPLAVIPVIGMATTYVVAASEEEAKFNNTELADRYRIYAAKTGRFFPKLWRSSRKPISE